MRTRVFLEAATVGGGWTTMLAVLLVANAYTNEPEPPYLRWVWVMLAVAAACAAVAALVVAGQWRVRQDGVTLSPGHVAGLGLGAAVWLVGGLWCYSWLIFHGAGPPVHCTFPGVQGESHCLSQDVGESLAWLLALSANGVLVCLAILAGFGRCSRIAALLSPALIAGLYGLARLLLGPRFL
ncbi:hypothetical protein [Actinomadura sp. 9N407]|uniref:hypothetical protein n=1 Tax=Actinomadura sp. 9N407 TaxID=3375154 RepID=UPI0037962650